MKIQKFKYWCPIPDLRMKQDLVRIKQETESVISGLENTVYAAARDVRALKKAGSRDYADAILDRHGFGGDTAEIYFYRFAPKGSPRPSNQVEFQALLADPERHKVYAEACYQRWVEGIQAVQRVIQRYGGAVEVDDIPLSDFLSLVKDPDKKPDHRVHVKISVPGQDKLRTLRRLVEK